MQGFPDSSVGKESACNTGDSGSIPGLGRSTGEGLGYPLQYSWASLVAQLVKNLPAMRETWVRSLGWEDPLEKGRLPTPVFQPGEFHGLYSVAESDTTERLSNAGDAGSIPGQGTKTPHAWGQLKPMHHDNQAQALRSPCSANY